MAFDLVVSRLEIEWVRKSESEPYSLSIEKRFGDGTVVRLLLNEAEVEYLTQINRNEMIQSEEKLCAV